MNTKVFFTAIFVLTLISFLLGAYLGPLITNYLSSSNINTKPLVIKDKPLDKYNIDNLSKTDIKESTIKIEENLKIYPEYESNLFSMIFSPTMDNKNQKKVTGILNIPKDIDQDKKYPLIIMLRGYVDQKIYQSGTGTKSAADFFAKNNFITIAPDFLGYGGSDSESQNIFESRFQTYVTVLSLIKSLNSVEKWNKKDIFIWAHSNGGQIALSVLEITKASYPTTLWAPVSKPFPYSILYYTDESEDKGKFIRKELSEFEKDYDVNNYSLDNYLGNIKAPIQIQQGTVDDAVPLEWSKNLYSRLKSLDIETFLNTYPGSDHNLKPSWNNVIEKDLIFFNKYL